MLRDCLLLFLSVHCCYGDQSFTIVVDTTNSMRQEIEIFKNNLEPIMQAMSSKHFDNFILIPFLHLDPGPPLVSQSPQGLVDLIDAIEVSERFGCRENSLSAIKKALEVSNPRSLIFVFTDAEAQDPDKMDSIQNLCVKQQSQVFIFQSGSCSQDSTLTENIYKKIVTSCGSSYSFFYLNDLQWAFQYMREIAKVDWTNVNTHKEFYGNKEYSFSVDVYTKAVVVAISGLKPQIEIKNNFDEKIRIDEIIVTSYMKVVRIPATMFGEYTADISCQDAAMVTVYIKKELNFRHGFSPLQPKSFRETTLLPIPGIMNYLLISLPDHNLQLDSIHLKIFDENDLRTFNHHAVDEKQRLYAATILIEPEKTFQILVKCRDYNNKEISGASKQMEPQRLVNESQRLVPKAEILEIDPLIDFGRGYSLACRVISYPIPHIWWENSMQEKLDSESALLEIPQVYISYVKIENVTKNETITCKCKNSEGEDAIDAHIYVNRTFTFDVVRSPSDSTFEYGSEGKLFCEANTYPEKEIKWYLNDTIIENSENIEIIPEENMLRIRNMNLDTTGQYVCQISNSVETRKLSAEVDISGLETPQVDLKRSEILLNRGDQTELQCSIIKGKPYPEISWKYKSKYDNNQLNDVPEGVVTDGATLRIDSADLHHEGVYVCVAINVLGRDEKQIFIKIQLPPEIKNEDEVRTVTLGDEVELPCDVEALPEVNVHWDKYEGDIAVPFDSRHSTDYSNTHRFKANNNDSGIYVCTAENSAGSAKRTVTITVLDVCPCLFPVAPYIEPLPWRSLAVERGSTVILSCNVVSGNPVPYSRWVFIAPNLDTTVLIRGHAVGNLEVILKNITKKHEGSYQCITENEVASDSVRASLTVQQ